MMSRILSSIKLLTLAAFMLCLLFACAAKQPILERQAAELAFKNAGPAEKCAWAKYHTADEMLSKAYKYNQEQQYEESRRHFVVAERISKDALAEAKANKDCMDEYEVKSEEALEEGGGVSGVGVGEASEKVELTRDYEPPLVHFRFDSVEIMSEYHDNLRNTAEWMLRFPNVTIVLEGHCDERGTGEYNLPLGEQRARAVRKFLIALGVPGDRFEILSFGHERPLSEAGNEEAWSVNRRVEFRKVWSE